MQLRMDSTSLANNSDLRWHLVFAKPRGEETAKVNLERQGYHVYFPRVQCKVLSRGRWQDAISPLFPRYLFVRLNSVRQSLGPIRSTLGVANVVRFGNDYIVVPDKVVQCLIGRANPESGLHQINTESLLTLGSSVCITAGALAGLEGIFERADANERVVVLLNILGNDTRIKIHSGFVMPSRMTNAIRDAAAKRNQLEHIQC